MREPNKRPTYAIKQASVLLPTPTLNRWIVLCVRFNRCVDRIFMVVRVKYLGRKERALPQIW